MNILDIIILAVLILGVWKGGHDGFIKSLCSFIGFTAGLLVALPFYKVVGDKLAPNLGENAQAAPILAFIIIWVAFPIAMNFVGNALTKFIKLLFLGPLNKVLGSVLGLVKYFLGATLVVYMLVLMDVISYEFACGSFFGSMMTAFVDSFMASL